MAKTLTFDYKGTEYTLEFTRRTVEQMERAGFKATMIVDQGMTMLPQLFAGAFRAHHPFMKADTISEIFKLIPDKGELISRLAEMYNEPLAELMAEPAKEDEGNVVSWKASW